MSRADISLACAASLVDELVAHGLMHACISPGSRSTPLALAFARHPKVKIHVNLDERSSGFFALGLVRGSHIPAAVVCTSGTAAAEFLPAVVEASQSAVPLFVLTADRPSRLRGTGANQTIDQVNLYGTYTRSYLEPPVPTSAEDVLAWQAVARQAVLAVSGARPGPVHINCPFEEPLVPAGPAVDSAPPDVTRVSRQDLAVEPQDVARVAAEVEGARGMIVIGPSPWLAPNHAVMLAEQIGWPVLAEPTSGERRTGSRPQVVLAAGQALVRSPEFLASHAPELILQLGATPTSRATQELVASVEDLVVIDRDHLDPDPEGHASLKLNADPEELAAALLGVWFTKPADGWIDEWLAADLSARRTIDEALDGMEEPTELRIARDVAHWIPSGGTLFAGNSMPIRDLDYVMAPRQGLRVMANRGASGIDGLVSTAMGVAASAASKEGPTIALIGDLSLLHDAGALLWNGDRGPDITFVVPNNGGGAIFSFLDHAGLPELEQLFTTPHHLDLEALCTAARVGYARIDHMTDLPNALERSTTAGGVRLVEVTVEPQRNRTQHSEIQELVDRALRESA
jgi:2-succinyl-5-enolpyruvyl-6-hydroxy-3-cyclohexene-1-carboxylate synthase